MNEAEQEINAPVEGDVVNSPQEPQEVPQGDSPASPDAPAEDGGAAEGDGADE